VEERLKSAELARVRAESRAAGERKRRLLVAGLAASLLALAALVGGGGLWFTWQRAARLEAADHEATVALWKASQPLGRARAAPEGELTPWVEADRASRQAEALLARSEVGPELRREIQDLVASAARERDQAEARSMDRRMVQRLVAIHTDMALHMDYGRADREYAAAFQDYRIDVNRLQPADAGARIAAAPIVVEMVDALDQWAFIRRVLARGDAPGARHLAAVAKAADPVSWRCRLRDALDVESTDGQRARAAFEELAATAPQDALHRESLSRLAFALGSLGKKEAAISLLRRAQRAHPDDFWINYDLARSLMGTR
jgi:serine/threonine-protein kinase